MIDKRYTVLVTEHEGDIHAFYTDDHDRAKDMVSEMGEARENVVFTDREGEVFLDDGDDAEALDDDESVDRFDYDEESAAREAQAEHEDYESGVKAWERAQG